MNVRMGFCSNWATVSFSWRTVFHGGRRIRKDGVEGEVAGLFQGETCLEKPVTLMGTSWIGGTCISVIPRWCGWHSLCELGRVWKQIVFFMFRCDNIWSGWIEGSTNIQLNGLCIWLTCKKFLDWISGSHIPTFLVLLCLVRSAVQQLVPQILSDP